MKLLSLEAENFLGLPDGTYSFTHPLNGVPLSPIVVTGGPSSGKSALLHAIVALKEAVGGYGVAPSEGSFLRSGKKAGRLQGTWLLREDERRRAELDTPHLVTEFDLGQGVVKAPEVAREDVFKAYSRSPEQGKFEYFSAGRWLATGVPLPEEADVARMRLSGVGNKYGGLEQELIRLSTLAGLGAIRKVESEGIVLRGDHKDPLVDYRASLRELCPRIALHRVEITEPVGTVWFERETGELLELSSLAQSELQAVLFAFAFLRYGLHHSVVLVDEPELHVHPDDQARFFSVVASLGPDNQVFAATSSSAIVDATPREQVIHLRPKRSKV